MNANDTVLAGRPSSQHPQGLRPISFPRFSVDPLSEPHAGAPAILVDELDAGGFQGAAIA
jgi:hypothetical protein